MSLLSNADFLVLADKIGWIWGRLLPIVGTDDDVASPVAGTIQYVANSVQNKVLALVDYEQETDMLAAANALLGQANVGLVCTSFVRSWLAGFNKHFTARGPSLDSTVNSIPKFLTYRNTTPYALLVDPWFAAAWSKALGSSLPQSGVMAPPVNPVWDSRVSAYGMGSRAVGGSFNDGDLIDGQTYSPGLSLLEITADFSGGSAAPSISVAGTDTAGASQTWTVTLDSNNPVSAVSTTITPSVTAGSRQTVAFGSVSGIIVGSVLTVNAGLVDEEKVIVETVAGSNVTAVFNKAHNAGAAVTGRRTYLLASTGGNRLLDATGITITISSHSAGTVRIFNRQPRVPSIA